MQKYQARVIEWEVRGREIVSGGRGGDKNSMESKVKGEG